MSSKTDRNQAEIVAALRANGWSVVSLAALGHGIPDLLVGKYKRCVLIECKDGKKPPSQRKLTPAEQAFFDSWPGECFVVENVEQARAL